MTAGGDIAEKVPKVATTLVEMGFPKSARSLQMYAAGGNVSETMVLLSPFLRKSKPYFNAPTFFGMSIDVRQAGKKSSYFWRDDTIVSISSKFTTDTGEQRRGYVPVLKVLFEAQYFGNAFRRQEMIERLVDIFAPSLIVRALDVLRAESGILTRMGGGSRITKEHLIGIFQRYASLPSNGVHEAPIERQTVPEDLYSFLKWKPQLRVLVSFAKREMAQVRLSGGLVTITPVNENPNVRLYAELHRRSSPRFLVYKNGECYVEERVGNRHVDRLHMVECLHDALENMWQNTLPKLNPTLIEHRPRRPYDEKRDELLLQRNRRV